MEYFLAYSAKTLDFFSIFGGNAEHFSAYSAKTVNIFQRVWRRQLIIFSMFSKNAEKIVTAFSKNAKHSFKTDRIYACSAKTLKKKKHRLRIRRKSFSVIRNNGDQFSASSENTQNIK